MISMQPRTVFITGATGTIGRAISELLAEKGYQLIIHGRDQQKLQNLKSYLEKKYKTDIFTVLFDFRSRSFLLREIEKFKSSYPYAVEVLINNASEVPKTRTLTEEMLECQFAVNVLGYHRMIAYLQEKFSSHARIINVASYWAGDLDINDLQFEKRKYNNNTAYRQSKQAERMLSCAWAEFLKSKNISVNSCHPGDANSRLSNDLGFGGSETPFQAAETPVYLATDEKISGITGKYFENKKPYNDPFCRNQELVNTLFHICRQYE